MKFFTASTLLAAGLVSAAVVIPFLPAARKDVESFGLEVRVTSSAEGHLQLYYDRGVGLNEGDSTSIPVMNGGEVRPYWLGLPAGTYRNLRFDPLDRDGTIVIEAARIADRQGRTLREISLSQFKPLNQIQSLREAHGRLEVAVVPGGNDPQLLVDFERPLQVPKDWGLAVREWGKRASAVFILLAAVLYALDRLPRARGRLVTGMHVIAQKPMRAIALAAAAAVAASAYPVIFLGKSYVSPNFGTVLLYDAFPTLPGYSEGQISDIRGSDVGAIMWQHVPFSAIQHRALLRDGELPWWNRYNSSGTPLIGQGQSMFGDPLHLLVVAAGGSSWSWDLKYLAAKWLFAFGLGLTVLAVARHLPAALLVSLAAPFAGFFVYRVNHPAFFSLCYAPWPLYCWIRATRAAGVRATAGWFAGLVLASGALLGSGTVKEAYMLLFTMNFAGVCVLLMDNSAWKIRLAKLCGAAWAGALFLLISAPLWGSFLATLKVAYTSYDAVSAYQIQPGMLLGAFDEAFYRPLSKGGVVFNPSANFLVLAGLLYFLATLRHHFANRAAVAVAVASLLPLSLAFGLVPPGWIMRLPFLANVAHIDNSFTCALIVLWSVLAGAGFSAAARRLGEREGRDDLIVAALLLFALVFAFVAFGQAVHRSVFGPGITFSPLNPGQSIPASPFVWTYLATLLTAVVAIGLLARRALNRRAVTPASGLTLGLCAVALLWRQGQHAGSGFPDYVVHPPARADFQAKSRAIAFMQDAVRSEPARGIGLQGNFFPGWTGVYGLEGISGPDALMNPSYRELTRASPLQNLWDWRLYLSRDNLAAARPFLDFLNVRYYFDLRSDQGALGAVLQLDRTGDLDIYESPTAWPRAFFTDRLGTYDEAGDLVRQILHGDGRPFAAVQSPDADPELNAYSNDLKGRAVVAATHYRLTEDSTSFDIDAPSHGLVVLTESYWPGYAHVEIDGHNAHVVRLNHAFQGVAIDAGTHRVTFSYRPRQAPMLLGLSIAGMLLLLASGWLSWKFDRSPG